MVFVPGKNGVYAFFRNNLVLKVTKDFIVSPPYANERELTCAQFSKCTSSCVLERRKRDRELEQRELNQRQKQKPLSFGKQFCEETPSEFEISEEK